MKLKSFKELKVFLHKNYTVCPRCGAYTNVAYFDIFCNEKICSSCNEEQIQIMDNILNYYKGIKNDKT